MLCSRRLRKNLAVRDRRDKRDEVKVYSVHVAPFSPVSHFARHRPLRIDEACPCI